MQVYKRSPFYFIFTMCILQYLILSAATFNIFVKLIFFFLFMGFRFFRFKDQNYYKILYSVDLKSRKYGNLQRMFFLRIHICTYFLHKLCDIIMCPESHKLHLNLLSKNLWEYSNKHLKTFQFIHSLVDNKFAKCFALIKFQQNATYLSGSSMDSYNRRNFFCNRQLTFRLCLSQCSTIDKKN